MKKICLAFALFIFITNAQAQLFKKKNKTVAKPDTAMVLNNTTTNIPAHKTDNKFALTSRANDHFLIQFGYDAWLRKPSYVNTGGFSRHFNMYLMTDKPFKTNKHFSSSYGLGITTNHIFFNNQYVDIAGKDSVSFKDHFSKDGADGNFDKFKISTIYLTLPVELRYFSNPTDPNHSYKVAIGAKVGLLIDAYTKGKNFVNSTGASFFGSSYIMKESSTKYFNSYLFSLTGRIGWGNFSLNADYHIVPVFTSGVAPQVNVLQVGLTVSGL